MIHEDNILGGLQLHSCAKGELIGLGWQKPVNGKRSSTAMTKDLVAAT